MAPAGSQQRSALALGALDWVHSKEPQHEHALGWTCWAPQQGVSGKPLCHAYGCSVPAVLGGKALQRRLQAARRVDSSEIDVSLTELFGAHNSVMSAVLLKVTGKALDGGPAGQPRSLTS